MHARDGRSSRATKGETAGFLESRLDCPPTSRSLLAEMKRKAPAGTLVLAFALACTAAALAPAQDPGSPRSFPGLIRIPAGNVVVGVTEKQAESRIVAARSPADRWVLGGEVGKHVESLSEYWISPTHVTNEMYLEYVKASSARPPATWLLLTKEERDRLITEGQSRDKTFVWDEDTQGVWWDKHWQDEGVRWEMPATEALEPVVFVTWKDAMNYCTWAGLRLPSEQELIRAGRGDAEYDYPFGAEFNREAVAHNATSPSGLAFKRLPVAMLPKNVSSFGVRDLIGNVWSWTTSPYKAYEGFPANGLKVKVKEPGEKKETEVRVIPNWDGSRKVIKGGANKDGNDFCRLDVRVGLDPEAAASLVGFRVAASGVPGRDAAMMRARSARSSVLGHSPERDLDGQVVLGLEHRVWPDMAEIASRRAAPVKPGFKQPELPVDYLVFGPCSSLALVPVADPFGSRDFPEIKSLEAAAGKDFDFPTFAVFTSSVQLKEPELPAGTYVLAWMPAFKDRQLLEIGALLPAKDMPKTPVTPDEIKMKRAGVSGLLIVPDKEHLLFLDADGLAVAALPLNDAFKLAAEKQVHHELVLNLAKGYWEYHVKLPGKSGKAYGLSFSVRTADAAFTQEGYWDGEFRIERPKPGASVGNTQLGTR